MKLLTFVSTAVLLSTPLASLAQNAGAPASQPGAAAAPKSEADLAYDAAWAAYREEAPGGIEHPSKEYFKWSDEKYQRFAEGIRAFGEKYPNDPRRYEGWVQSSFTGPSFIIGFKPGFDEKPNYSNLVSDEAKVIAFRSKQVELLTKVLEADDATPRHRGGAFYALLIDAGTVARLKGEKLDVKQFRPLVDRLIAKFGDERILPIVEQYSGALRRQSAADADAFESSLQSTPKIATAIAAAKEKRAADEAAAAEKMRLGAAELKSMKFTAADGREVDVSKLKGKVVLVDFWATWCGPCIAELPSIKKVYAKYHDKGFEIIGVTLENPNARPNDTAEQTAKKLEAAKQKMLDFVAKNEMPWPQYFDGKWWKNDYATKYGINAIPAMFLLDQQGNVVTTEARGEKLEAEVKRLLGV